MCAGDMTVEWPREEEDGRRIAVDGWWIDHRCKDWVSSSFPVSVAESVECVDADFKMYCRAPSWVS